MTKHRYHYPYVYRRIETLEEQSRRVADDPSADTVVPAYRVVVVYGDQDRSLGPFDLDAATEAARAINEAIELTRDIARGAILRSYPNESENGGA